MNKISDYYYELFCLSNTYTMRKISIYKRSYIYVIILYILIRCFGSSRARFLLVRLLLLKQSNLGAQPSLRRLKARGLTTQSQAVDLRLAFT